MVEAESSFGSISWGEAARGLRLGLAAGAGAVEMFLQNVGAESLEVLSHVQAQEKHFDWYALSLTDAKGVTRRLRLRDDRDKSGVVRAWLEPGESIRHTLDVSGWAARAANGAEPLAPGAYRLTVVYEVDSAQDAWSGRIEAGPVTLTVG